MIKHSSSSTLVKEQHAKRFDINKRWYFFTLNIGYTEEVLLTEQKLKGYRG